MLNESNVNDVISSSSKEPLIEEFIVFTIEDTPIFPNAFIYSALNERDIEKFLTGIVESDKPTVSLSELESRFDRGSS